jgi:hypothetical protein
VVGIVVFAWLAPMRIARGGTGLPFAIVSVPLIAAFWSSLSLVVAMAAVTVALAYRDGVGQKRGRAVAALVLGDLASVVTLGAILIG